MNLSNFVVKLFKFLAENYKPIFPEMNTPITGYDMINTLEKVVTCMVHLPLLTIFLHSFLINNTNMLLKKTQYMKYNTYPIAH